MGGCAVMIVGLSGLERTFALKLRVMNKRESGGRHATRIII
ncbi:protein of unknown function [Lactiplantibacillus plantarum]